jgi:hypothetical protein
LYGNKHAPTEGGEHSAPAPPLKITIDIPGENVGVLFSAFQHMCMPLAASRF